MDRSQAFLHDFVSNLLAGFASSVSTSPLAALAFDSRYQFCRGGEVAFVRIAGHNYPAVYGFGLLRCRFGFEVVAGSGRRRHREALRRPLKTRGNRIRPENLWPGAQNAWRAHPFKPLQAASCRYKLRGPRGPRWQNRDALGRQSGVICLSRLFRTPGGPPGSANLA